MGLNEAIIIAGMTAKQARTMKWGVNRNRKILITMPLQQSV
jgi:hypothetical protein